MIRVGCMKGGRIGVRGPSDYGGPATANRWRRQQGRGGPERKACHCIEQRQQEKGDDSGLNQ